MFPYALGEYALGESPIEGAPVVSGQALSDSISSSIASGDSVPGPTYAQDDIYSQEQISAYVELDASTQDTSFSQEQIAGVLLYEGSAISYTMSVSVADGEAALGGGDAISQSYSVSIGVASLEVYGQSNDSVISSETGTATVPSTGRIFGPALQSG